MRNSRRPLIIAARTSALARAQTQWVAKLLAAADPTLVIEFRWIESAGDQQPDVPLSAIGGKGLFARALEDALLQEKADLAVHSYKDLPVAATAGLTIAAVPPRADPRDALVSAAGYAAISDLPKAARVGTASPRRAAQLRRLRPDLRIELLRGNIDTRIRKVVQDRLFDAALLAVAGLQRANLGQHALHPIDPSLMLPAPAQGCLALQCRGDDHVTLRRCLPINDAQASTTATAERQIVAGLHADCHAALGVFAEFAAPSGAAEVSRQDRGLPQVRLRVRAMSADGAKCVEADVQTPARHLGKLVKRTLIDLRSRHAIEILAGK